MKTDEKAVDLGFTTESLPAGTHICMLYSDEAERRRVIAKYLGCGIEGKEKVSYFADIMTPEETRGWLKDLGVKLPDDESFYLAPAVQTYCPDGKFVPEQMIEGLKEMYDSAMKKGYPHARASGEMTWALKGIPGSERLIEYEALLNEVFVTHPVIGLCQYDVNRFSGAAILDVLKVHPMMIVNGRIMRNPYYMEPGTFLKEYFSRK